MLPNMTIVIGKDGSQKIVGNEHSDLCYKIGDLARSAGKVIEEKKKDHTPVYQTIYQKGGN